jgi:hypothetical protein
VKSRLAGFLVLLLTAVALSFPQHQPASAAQRWQRMMLSRDGIHWKPDLALPVFARKVVLVPGRQRTRTFYVRNQGGGPARLGVTVNVTSASGLVEHRMFRMAVRVRDGRFQRIRHTGRHKLAHLRVAKGRMVPVTIRVRLLPRAGNRTMDGHYQFVTRVRLSSDKKR